MSSVEKTWPTNQCYYKMIWNKRNLATEHGEDYDRMFVRLWIWHQKSLQIYSSWFELTKRIRWWRESNSANQIHCAIKKTRQQLLQAMTNPF